MHTWKDPEKNQIKTQNQAKQNDWSKRTWKKRPINVTQTTTEGVTLSLSSSMYLSTRTFFPPKKHFTCFTTFCLYVEILFYTSDMSGPCYWSLSLVIKWLGFSTVTAQPQTLATNQNLASSSSRPRPLKISFP